MAYVARAPQGRRQDEGEVGGGASYGQTGGVQGTAKQSSTAKTPLQEQVRRASPVGGAAAADRLYQPVKSGIEQAAGQLNQGAGAYAENQSKADLEAGYGTSAEDIRGQLSRRELSPELSKVAGGQKRQVGELNLTAPTIQSAAEIMKGGGAPGLMRQARGKYTGGMVALDNQVLRSSGALGSLVPRVQQDMAGLRNMETGIEKSATEQARAAADASFAGAQERLGRTAKDMMTRLGDAADYRTEQVKQKLATQRAEQKAKAQSILEKALSEAAGDQATWGNQPEFEALRGIDINSFIRDVEDPRTELATLLPEEAEQWNYLGDITGKTLGHYYGTARGGYQGGDVGLDDMGLNAAIQKQLGGWKTRKEAEEKRVRELPPAYPEGLVPLGQLGEAETPTQRANREAIDFQRQLEAQRLREIQEYGAPQGPASWDRQAEALVDADDDGIEDRTPTDDTIDEVLVGEPPPQSGEPAWIGAEPEKGSRGGKAGPLSFLSRLFGGR